MVKKGEEMRIGFYLIPPYPLALKILELRNLVYDQYRIKAALNFMIHMTIKGFFKPKRNFNLAELINVLDKIISKYKPFTIFPAGFKIFDNEGIALVFSKDLNPILWELHGECYDAIEPFIAPDCNFTPKEDIKENFIPHITISMTDVTQDTLVDIYDFFKEVTFGTHGYTVHNFKLYQFESENWHSDEWIYTLKWKILKSWRLS